MSDSDRRAAAAGRWIRTRRDGKSPAKSQYGKGRGYGPPRPKTKSSSKTAAGRPLWLRPLLRPTGFAKNVIPTTPSRTLAAPKPVSKDVAEFAALARSKAVDPLAMVEALGSVSKDTRNNRRQFNKALGAIMVGVPAARRHAAAASRVKGGYAISTAVNPVENAFQAGTRVIQKDPYQKRVGWKTLRDAGLLGGFNAGAYYLLKSLFPSKESSMPSWLTKQAMDVPDINAGDILGGGDGVGGIADYISPQALGGERAGRSKAVAEALGIKPSFNLRHPLTHTMLSSTAGGGVGTALGQVLRRNLEGRLPYHAEAFMPLILGSLGTLAGVGYSGLTRQREMRKIKRELDEASEAEKEKLKKTEYPKLSRAEALLLPLRGPMRSGQMDAISQLRGEYDQNDFRRLRNLERVLYAVQTVPVPLPGVNESAQVVGGYSQNYRTQRKSEEKKREREEEESKKEDKKKKRKKKQKKSPFRASDWLRE